MIEGFRRETFYFKDKNSFLYKKTNQKHTTSYYTCIKSDCSGSCVDNGIGGVSFPRGHQHAADPKDVYHLRFLAMLRHECSSTIDKYQSVFHRCRLAHPEGAAQAGKLDKCIGIMKGAREAYSSLVPKSLNEFAEMMEDKE